MLVKQIINSNQFWTLNKTLVRELGIETAFLLSILAEAETLKSDSDGWFYQTSETIKGITGMSTHVQTKCIKKLISRNMIMQENRGIPMKRYFKFNYEEIQKQVFKNFKNYNCNSSKTTSSNFEKNKELSNKELNNKELNKELVSKDTRGTNEPHSKIIELWNSLPVQNIKYIKSETNRYKMLNARIKQYGLDEVVKSIKNIDESSFLKGDNKRGWIITFDWFLKPNNFVKVHENNYADNPGDKTIKNKNESFTPKKKNQSEVICESVLGEREEEW